MAWIKWKKRFILGIFSLLALAGCSVHSEKGIKIDDENIEANTKVTFDREFEAKTTTISVMNQMSSTDPSNKNSQEETTMPVVTDIKADDMTANLITTAETNVSVSDTATEETNISVSDAATEETNISVSDATTEEANISVSDTATEETNVSVSDATTEEANISVSDATTEEANISVSDTATEETNISVSDAATEETNVSVSDATTEEANVNLEDVTVHIAGLRKKYTLLFVSDLHIIIENEEVAETNKNIVKSRAEGFSHYSNGKWEKSAEFWKLLPNKLDSYNADAILFGGDMVDFASYGNINRLTEGLNMLKTPYLYVGADHDFSPYYSTVQRDYSDRLYSDAGLNSEVPFIEFEDLIIAGINNSTSNITESALNEFKRLYSKGKSIILLIHVPIKSKVSPDLDNMSKAVWQNRSLLWGYSDCTYKPDKYTGEFLELIYKEDSLVKEVLSGHLHFSFDGPITEDVGQHVFNPAYSGSIGVIHVEP